VFMNTKPHLKQVVPSLSRNQVQCLSVHSCVFVYVMRTHYRLDSSTIEHGNSCLATTLQPIADKVKLKIPLTHTTLHTTRARVRTHTHTHYTTLHTHTHYTTHTHHTHTLQTHTRAHDANLVMALLTDMRHNLTPYYLPASTCP